MKPKLTVAELEAMLKTLPSDYEIEFVDENSGRELRLMEALIIRRSTREHAGQYCISLAAVGEQKVSGAGNLSERKSESELTA